MLVEKGVVRIFDNRFLNVRLASSERRVCNSAVTPVVTLFHFGATFNHTTVFG